MSHYIEHYSVPFRQKSFSTVAQTTEKLTSLSNLSRFLVGADTVEDLIDRASAYIIDLLHIDYCRIYILEQSFQNKYHNLDTKNLNIFDGIVKRITSEEKTHQSSLLDYSLTPQEKLVLGLSDKDCHMIVPLKVEAYVAGLLLLVKKDARFEDTFRNNDVIYMIDLIADQLANALHRKQLNEKLVNSSIETVIALSKTLETRDSYSGSHSKRMASFSEQIAQQFNFSIRETRELCWAALLHDIGKIGIEDQILHKPGPLTAHEWDVMKTHPEIGAQIVRGLTGLEKIAPLIYSHHERVDGSGYPRGLKGEDIPLGARIIAVVDSYAAMTEGRVYRAPRTHEEAVAELIKFSGKMYDADVVRTFVSLFDEEVV